MGRDDDEEEEESGEDIGVGEVGRVIDFTTWGLKTWDWPDVQGRREE